MDGTEFMKKPPGITWNGMFVSKYFTERKKRNGNIGTSEMDFHFRSILSPISSCEITDNLGPWDMCDRFPSVLGRTESVPSDAVKQLTDFGVRMLA